MLKIPKPGFSKIMALTDLLKGEKWVQVQFQLPTILGAIGKITMQQYNYIYALYLNNKKLKLREELIKIGVKTNRPYYNKK